MSTFPSINVKSVRNILSGGNLCYNIWKDGIRRHCIRKWSKLFRPCLVTLRVYQCPDGLHQLKTTIEIDLVDLLDYIRSTCKSNYLLGSFFVCFSLILKWVVLCYLSNTCTVYIDYFLESSCFTIFKYKPNFNFFNSKFTDIQDSYSKV